MYLKELHAVCELGLIKNDNLLKQFLCLLLLFMKYIENTAYTLFILDIIWKIRNYQQFFKGFNKNHQNLLILKISEYEQN